MDGDDPSPLDYQSRASRKDDHSIWPAAFVGFGQSVGVVTVVVGMGVIMAGDVVSRSWRMPAVAGLFVVLAVIVLLPIRWLSRRGHAAGCALGIGVCLLCPVVGFLVICGNMRF